MTEEEAELIRCNRYFDIVDTVINKIQREIKKSAECLINKDDWEILKNHLIGLGQISKEYVDLKESLGL